MKQLDPKAANLFFYQSITVISFMCLSFSMLAIIPLIFFPYDSLFGVAAGIGYVFLLILLYIFFIVLGYFYSRAAYKNYKYELRSDGFRKESGVIWKSYVTIPYEKIQNVDIVRGVFARMLNLSDLRIQTAGSSLAILAEGVLPALDPQVAEELRDELIKRSRGKNP